MMSALKNGMMMDVAVSALSPSKTCRVRVSSTRYRHDPYRAKVTPSPVIRKTVVLPPAALKPAAAVPKALAPKAAAPLPVPASAKKAKTAASPKAPAAAPGPKYALVGFKHEACMYQAPFRVSVGDEVVVEADRGEHVGMVVEILTKAPSYEVPDRILRRATKADQQCIAMLRDRENATAVSAQRLAESLGLGIKVLDAEFQSDGNKLTVFFASKCFVDFRKLQRSLFREYRCRIWLVNWNEVCTYERPQLS